jgi:multiple sugar transport system permease protein
VNRWRSNSGSGGNGEALAGEENVVSFAGQLGGGGARPLCSAQDLFFGGSFMQVMSATRSAQTAPALLKLSADNWRLAILVGLVVSAFAVTTLPASGSFWVIGAMSALVAAAFAVNAYRRRYYGGLLVAPAIAVLFVMNIFPLLWSLGLSFFAYQSNLQSIRFVGLNNYLRALTDEVAAPGNWHALTNTAMFVVCTVSAQMIVGFFLAMLFAKQFPLRKYLLILVLTPMMLSVVASGVFFTYYYDPTFGILSYVVNSAAGGQFILMDSKAGAVAGIVLADAWMWSPFVMLLVLAGLVSVPKYLYEAAAIDRVPAWRRFWSITFPYIRGLLMLALLFRTIEAFKLADLVIVLTKGGNDTMTISYHLIRIANEQNKTSEGAAISYIMLFIVIVLTNLYLYVANPKHQGA